MAANAKTKAATKRGKAKLAEVNGAKAEAEQPKFDFSRVSRRWMRDLMNSVRDIAALREAVDSGSPEDVPEDERTDYVVAQMEAVEKVEELQGQQEQMIAQVLVSVPRDWLVADAPDDIDWSDPDSLIDFLQFWRHNDMVTLLFDQLKEYRGNSARASASS